MARAPQTIEHLLEDQRDAFDLLLNEISFGIRGAEHFDQLEERALQIGRGIRDAFRRGETRRGCQ